MQVHGRCHCGEVRYEAGVDPARSIICHCTDCQALTGTAYRVSIPASDGSFRLVAGEPKTYIKVGGSGARRVMAFCANCGSQLFAYGADDEPRAYTLRVGVLAERSSLEPRRQKWRRSALPWTRDLTAIASEDRE